MIYNHSWSNFLSITPHPGPYFLHFILVHSGWTLVTPHNSLILASTEDSSIICYDALFQDWWKAPSTPPRRIHAVDDVSLSKIYWWEPLAQAWQMDTAKGWISSIWHVLFLCNPVPCNEKGVTLLSASPHWIDGIFKSASSRLEKGLSFVLQYDSTMIPSPTPKWSWSNTPQLNIPQLDASHISWFNLEVPWNPHLISLHSDLLEPTGAFPVWYTPCPQPIPQALGFYLRNQRDEIQSLSRAPSDK